MRSWQVITALAAALLVWSVCAARADFLIDDAYISFRYARAWSETGIPAYNPGESPPVEGYSNLLWVLLLRLGLGLGLAPEVLAPALSALCAGATLLVLAQTVTRLGLTPGASVATLLALAAYAPFFVWTTGGRETALFGLLLLATWTLLAGADGLRAGALAGLCAGLLAATRPEGFVWIGVVLISLLSTSALRPSSRALTGFALTAALGLVALFSWRLSVHGQLLPNTVAAKAGISGASMARGARSSASLLLTTGWPLLALLAPLVCVRERRSLVLTVWLPFCAAFAYDVLVGGDWMPMFRFHAPAAVFGALALGLALERTGRAAAPLGVGLAALAALPAWDLSLAPERLRRSLDFREFRTGYQTEWQRWEQGRANLASFIAIGKGLDHVTTQAGSVEPAASITLGAIGAIGYHSGLVVYDRNGLVEREVAMREATAVRSAGHDKRVPRSFFLDRAPTYFEALLVPRGPSQVQGALAAGSRQLGARLQREGDAALFSSTVVRAHLLEAGVAGDRPQTLLLVEGASEAEARAFWGPLGF